MVGHARFARSSLRSPSFASLISGPSSRAVVLWSISPLRTRSPACARSEVRLRTCLVHTHRPPHLSCLSSPLSPTHTRVVGQLLLVFGFWQFRERNSRRTSTTTCLSSPCRTKRRPSVVRRGVRPFPARASPGRTSTHLDIAATKRLQPACASGASGY